MIIKDNWRECRDRYTAFWGNERVDRPPVLFDAVGGLGNPMYRGVGYDYTRYGEDVAAFRDDYLAVWEARAACRDDAVPCISPQMGGAIEAAFWAGELEWGTEVVTLRPAHPLAGVRDLASVRFNERNPYYVRLLGEIAFLSRSASGRYGVNAEASLSVTTTISQLIGAERYLLGATDEPEGIRSLAEHITEQLLGLLEQVKATVPLPDGGTCHRWLNYWNPGWGFWFSEDDAILLSPSIYRDLFADLDAKLTASSPCTAIHWHSAGAHILDEILKLPRLRMIQLSFDPPGGLGGANGLDALLQILEPFTRQGGKVCFQIGYDPDVLRSIFRRVPNSSCMFYLGSAQDIPSANAAVAEVERICRIVPVRRRQKVR